MDLPVPRLICQHTLQEVSKVLPLLELGELRVNLTGLDFQSGKQIQRAVTLVSALHRTHYFAAIGFHIAGGPFDNIILSQPPRVYGAAGTSTQARPAVLANSASRICNCRSPSTNCGYSIGAEASSTEW